jgi:DNA-binding MarR family transcriptional regulator
MTREFSGIADQVMKVSMWMARHYNWRFQHELGLTPAVARSFLQLDPDRAIPTRELAAMLNCDASNVTAFVDRLEQAGLVERQVDPADRRVKTLSVTAKGRDMRRRMDDIRDTDSPAIQALTAAERKTLSRLLDKAWDACLAHEAARCADPRHGS